MCPGMNSFVNTPVTQGGEISPLPFAKNNPPPILLIMLNFDSNNAFCLPLEGCTWIVLCQSLYTRKEKQSFILWILQNDKIVNGLHFYLACHSNRRGDTKVPCCLVTLLWKVKQQGYLLKTFLYVNMKSFLMICRAFSQSNPGAQTGVSAQGPFTSFGNKVSTDNFTP